MAAEGFAPGDLVRLKSGGMPMTVSSIVTTDSARTVTVVWMRTMSIVAVPEVVLDFAAAE